MQMVAGFVLWALVYQPLINTDMSLALSECAQDNTPHEASL